MQCGERAGWEGERADRLRTERRPGVWHSGELESDNVGGRSVGRDGVCVFSSHSFWTSMDVPAGVTQEEGHTGFFIHLLSAVRAFIFLARRIQPFLFLVDREVEFCVLMIQSFSTRWAFLFLFFSFLVRKIPFAGIELTSQRVRGLRGTSELPGRPAWVKVYGHVKERRKIRDSKSHYRTRKRRTCEVTTISLLDRTKESCTGTRPTETCVAPRHVDALRGTLLATCSWYFAFCTRLLLLLFFSSVPGA